MARANRNRALVLLRARVTELEQQYNALGNALVTMRVLEKDMAEAYARKPARKPAARGKPHLAMNEVASAPLKPRTGPGTITDMMDT